MKEFFFVLFIGWNSHKAHTRAHACVIPSSPCSFFCVWHENTWIEDNWAWNQPTPSIYFQPKSRGDIAVISFVRLFCHLFIKSEFFIWTCRCYVKQQLYRAHWVTEIDRRTEGENETMTVRYTFISYIFYVIWMNVIKNRFFFSRLDRDQNRKTHTNTHAQSNAQNKIMKCRYT